MKIEETLFEGKGWTVTVETAPLPDGREKTAVRVHRCDTVHILAFPKPGYVLMLEEFRPFLGKVQWMIPSGKIDKETDRLEAAQRELREESGFRANDLQYQCTFQNTDSIQIQNHLFIAKDLVADPLPQDDSEMITVHEMTIQDAIERVLDCDPIHTITLASLQLALRQSK